jgi:hypothetical protein
MFCIEDIYVLKIGEDPTKLSRENLYFINQFKENILMYIWKYNLLM